jgi:hypothetical protein
VHFFAVHNTYRNTHFLSNNLRLLPHRQNHPDDFFN